MNNTENPIEVIRKIALSKSNSVGNFYRIIDKSNNKNDYMSLAMEEFKNKNIDSQGRIRLLDLMVHLDTSAFPSMINKYLGEEKDEEVRKRIIWLLQHCCDRSSVPYLIKGLIKEGNVDNKIMILHTLAHLNDPASIEEIKKFIADDSYSVAYEITVGHEASKVIEAIISSARNLPTHTD